MKVCPKCQAVNKNQNILCASCQEYIGAAEIIDDPTYGRRIIEHEVRRVKIRNTSALVLFLIVYAGFLIFFGTVCCTVFGDLQYWFAMFPWYIPCLILFLFPYNKTYQWVLKKRRKPIKPLSEYWTIFFRAAAVIYLFLLCVEMYNTIARHSPHAL